MSFEDKIKDVYVLSPMQSGMLYHSLLDKHSGAYIEQSEFIIEGDINPKILEQSFNKVIDRYDILRTVFIYEDLDLPLQVVLKKRDIKLKYNEITDITSEEQERIIGDYKIKERYEGFDLSRDNLTKVTLFKTGEQKYSLIWSFHHILMDGWCTTILFRDLLAYYSSIKTGVDYKLPLTNNYRKYIDWLEEQDKEASLTFWGSYLADFEGANSFPKKLNIADKYIRGESSLELDSPIMTQLIDFASKFGVTQNLVIQAVWGLLLQRYNNSDDAIFGAVTSGRPSEIEHVEEMVGLFINTVPIRVRSEFDDTFETLLRRLQENTQEMKNYEYSALAEIQSLTEKRADLIDHIMAFQNYAINEGYKELGDSNSKLDVSFKVVGMHSEEQTSYNLNLLVVPSNNLAIKISYNKNIYDDFIISNALTHFEKILRSVLSDSDLTLKEIEIITESEKELILNVFNDTATDYPKDKTIQELFEEQVERTPDNVALVFENSQLTYKKLNNKSNQLARTLRDKGVKSDEIVGLMVERSLEMIIGIMGILKTGGAYLPIDPDYPEVRKLFMLEDSRAKILLTSSVVYNDFEYEGEGLFLDEDNIYSNDGSNLLRMSQPSDLCYIIYTSGTTGKPKGVMIEHGNLVRLMFNDKFQFDFNEKDVWTMFHSYCFDFSVWEMYGALLYGGKLIIIPKVITRDTSIYLQILKNNKVTILNQTPSAFYSLVSEELSNEDKSLEIRNVIFGGEALTPIKLKNWRVKYPTIKLVNMFGITETTVHVTYKEIGDYEIENNISNIGKPIPTLTTYIMDDNRKLVPIGVSGELFVGGLGVCRGYLYNDELTRERFVLNPYNPSERLYRTGDLCRWLSNGDMEYLGRIDHQVKIRGFRIELGEIENQLLSIDNIKEVVVIDKVDKEGLKYLVAYIVSGIDIESSELRNELSKTLPDYMIPAYFVRLDKIPLTSNGKTDRRSLPEPEIVVKDYIAPRNEIEEKLVEIWSEVLGIERDKVSIDSNFFELGGDSIKTIQIASRLNRYGLKLSVADVFKYPRIGQLSIRLKKVDRVINQEIVTGEIQLTPIQSWFLNSGFTDVHHFNHAVMLYKRDGFDLDIVDRVLKELTIHHDILRTTFSKRDNRYTQYSNGIEENNYSITSYDFRRKADYAKLVEEESTRIQSSIDLSTGPLLKAGHFITDNGDHLLIAVHHLLIDGVSWRIFFEDFSLIYNAILNGKAVLLPSKTDPFKYWSEKLQEYANNSKLTREKTYWDRVTRDVIPLLQKDNIISKEQKVNKNQRSISVNFSEVETEDILKNCNKAYNTEINDILLSSLVSSVCEWSRIEKIAIELEGHGREQLFEDIDINRTIGWFTTQYPVVLKHSKDVSSQIKETKESLRQIPNKGIGYGILKYLSNDESGLSNVEPEICFNYLGEFTGNGISSFEEDVLYGFSNLSYGESVSPLMESKYKLNINGMTSDGVLSFTFGYNLYEYTEETILRLTDLFKSSLLGIAEHCKQKEEKEFTPSDYGLKNMSLNDYDKLVYNLNQESFKDIEDIYELSPMQSGMLYHSLIDGHSGAYFEQFEFKIEGEINSEILEYSFNKVIDRYDILRTVFIYEDLDNPLQVVLKNRDIKLNYKDISNINNDEQKVLLEDYKTKERHDGFDLSRDNLTKVTLFKIGEQEYKLIWSHHHILMDGWCTTILFRDLLNFYSSIKNGTEYKLPITNNYRKYIDWLGEQDEEASLSFWKNCLSDFEGANSLPKISNPNKGYVKGNISLELDNEIMKKLTGFASSNGVTPNLVIQAVWGLLLQRYNNSDDAVFGAVTSGRPSEIEHVEEMVGLFINTIPIRIKSEANDSFISLLKRLQENTKEMKSYEYSSLAQVQSLTEKGTGLIDHIMVFQNYAINEGFKEIGDSNSKLDLGFKVVVNNTEEQTNYNLNIMVSPGDNLELTIDYNKNTYEENTISNVLIHFRNILESVLVNSSRKLSEIEIITEAEKQRIIYEFNDTHADYPEDKVIHELFEEQVDRSPDNVALVFENSQMTYRELNAKSNQLARTLRDKGVKFDSIVGIMIERSIEMIIGIIGILKAGGAYLPLDPEYPEERKLYMLEDSKSEILLTSSEVYKDFWYEGEILLLDEKNIYSGNEKNLSIINNPNDLAYIIYTSGTTGKPKGVMIEHKSVIRLVKGQAYIKFNIEENFLQTGALEFDASTFEVWGALLNSITLFLVDKVSLISIDVFKATIEKCDIKTMWLTSSLFNQISQSEITTFKGVKNLLVGGDVLSPTHINMLRKKYSNINIVNGYGPTENTTFSTTFPIDKDYISNIPIGKPISNTQLYIVNQSNKIQPIGVSGELLIGGVGLARGYLNRPDLTVEKFIYWEPDTGKVYNESTKPETAIRVYRTGDLCRWLPDGNIEFLGRIDHQVKIRGFRIELGEIENQLLNIESIKNAVVIAKEDNEGQKYLVAYLVSETLLETSYLRSGLSKTLPDYMIPSYFVRMEKIPLTSNGKVDRRALPDPEIVVGGDYIAPSNEIEDKLVEIWSEVLGIEKDKISVDANFFELGGHSLKATILMSKIHKVFDVKIPLAEIFKFPTIILLSKDISEAKGYLCKINFDENIKTERISL